MSEKVTDTRRCPCGHVHPNGIGASWCLCNDCWLLWSAIPRSALTPEYRDRLDDLLRRVEGVGS
jgi:hypothetical protein